MSKETEALKENHHSRSSSLSNDPNSNGFVKGFYVSLSYKRRTKSYASTNIEASRQIMETGLRSVSGLTLLKREAKKKKRKRRFVSIFALFCRIK